MSTTAAVTAFHPNGWAGGTSLQGYVFTTFSDLTSIFGPPHEWNGDKTTVFWSFSTDDGTRFTIYDWKEDETPSGTYRWHIGGTSIEAVAAVHSIMLQRGVDIDESLPFPRSPCY
jgi:hypothetical protein